VLKKAVAIKQHSPQLPATPSNMSTHLIELLQNLPQTRVALVGDLMLDRYVYGNA